MLHDASAWLAAALFVYAVAVNVGWWAAEHGSAPAGARIDVVLGASRWLYLGGLPLAALGLGVMPLWLAGWIAPPSWPMAVSGGLLAAALGAAAVVLRQRPAMDGRSSGGGGWRRPSLERLGAGLAAVVLREAHWGFVRAGVVAAAPGWFAVPGGTFVGLGQAVILFVLVLELWVHPNVRHAAVHPNGAQWVSSLAAAAAASHLGWMLAGTAGAGLAAHVVVALVALGYPSAAIVGTDAAHAADIRLDGPGHAIEPTIIG